jgi:hypothetical protein
MIHLGIDTGLDGALCCVCAGEATFFDTPTFKRAKREYDTARMATILKPYAGARCRAVIEAVSGRPGQGTASARSIGLGFGVWIGMLAAYSIPYQVVQPAVWKRKFGLIGAEKKASIAVALQRIPGAADSLKRAKDHNRADALLLALWLSEK